MISKKDHSYASRPRNTKRRVLRRMKSDLGSSHVQLNNGAGACLLSHATPFPSRGVVHSVMHAAAMDSSHGTTGLEWNRKEISARPCLTLACWGCVALSSFSGLKICMCVEVASLKSFWAVSRLQSYACVCQGLRLDGMVGSWVLSGGRGDGGKGILSARGDGYIRDDVKGCGLLLWFF